MNQVYKIVTDRIVGMLQEGVIPWERPVINGFNAPRGYDMAPNDTYHGVNLLLLPKNGEYLTERSIAEKGGRIINKDDFYIATFFKMAKVRESEQDENGSISEETLRPCFRYYKVFHIDNVEGIPSKASGRSEDEVNACPAADAVIAAYSEKNGISLAHIACDAPFFQEETRTLTLPFKRQFVNDESYYSAVFYELVLAEQRQADRSQGGRRRTDSDYDPEYTCERLVAEMGAAFLMSHCGLENAKVLRNSAARIQGWIKALGAHPTLAVYAAKQADHIAEAVIKSLTAVTEAA